MVGNGVFQFGVTNIAQNISFTVLSSTDIALPFPQWTVIGAASNVAPGLFQFTDTNANGGQCFYTVRSP